VSTEKQEREETVARQVDLLQQTATARGYEVLPGNVFIDDGVSGTRLDRPALERLRDLAAEGAFEVVLVTAPDRLARRYAYQVVLVDELTRQGCEVVFVQQSLGASPAEQMLLQMQGVFAEYERALIHERTRRGQLFAARQGRVNWGNPPGEWPPLCQAAASRADSEAVSDTGGAGAVVTNCPRLSHCWASQPLQS